MSTIIKFEREEKMFKVFWRRSKDYSITSQPIVLTLQATRPIHSSLQVNNKYLPQRCTLLFNFLYHQHRAIYCQSVFPTGNSLRKKSIKKITEVSFIKEYCSVVLEYISVNPLKIFSVSLKGLWLFLNKLF